VPFPVALRNFARKMNDPFIDNMINLVEKAAEFSPDLGSSMDEIYNYIELTRELERERSTLLFPQLISLYMVYFVLLATVYIVFRFFVPSFGAGDIGAYKALFGHLIIVESLLAGFSTGRIIENTFTSGIKHALILLCIGICFIYFYKFL
ncbi:MAG: type II secretion system F family protein, partial [Candidatus Aenigmatarchaeota archaeon]